MGRRSVNSNSDAKYIGPCFTVPAAYEWIRVFTGRAEPPEEWLEASDIIVKYILQLHQLYPDEEEEIPDFDLWYKGDHQPEPVFILATSKVSLARSETPEAYEDLKPEKEDETALEWLKSHSNPKNGEDPAGFAHGLVLSGWATVVVAESS